MTKVRNDLKTLMPTHPINAFRPLQQSLIWMLAALTAIGYWCAFSLHAGPAAILLSLPCLFCLARVRTSRQAFYVGLAVGIAMYAPHLLFFKAVFGPRGLLLWLIAGFPIGIFLLLLNHAHRRLGPAWTLFLTPILWTGIEYFRSELYYLRFAWLLPGQVAAFLPGVRWAAVGVYGLGFVYALAAALAVGPRPIIRGIGLAALIGLALLMYVPAHSFIRVESDLHVAGMQLEFPDENTTAAQLDRLANAHPEAQILVLSELTFLGPVPSGVREVIQKHRRYLIVGGTRTLDDGQFYNTAFVIGPDGRDVFNQAKSVPVQFMSDGRPAVDRQVWNSPWGKIGIAVCYDLSYAGIMDDFVRQGAQGLIIPTMDLAGWGEYERRMLHGRMAPIRSAEYGIPTFGVWSSGISQLTDRSGRVIATAAYPGQEEMIAGPFDLSRTGRLPPDRFLALLCTVITGAFIVYLLAMHLKQSREIKRHQAL